jgi:hypothetical protein
MLRDQIYRHRLGILATTLIAFGLWVRIIAIRSIGGVDSEWWKAWMYATGNFGLFDVYTAINDWDVPLLNRFDVVRYLEPFPIFSGQRVIDYLSFDYGRVEFPVAQPPLFLADMLVTEKFRGAIQGDWFIHSELNSAYVALNLTGMLWTVFLSVVVFKILKALNLSNPLLWTILAVWLNPALILSTPVQGFRDVPMVAILCVSVLMLIRGKLAKGGVYFGLAAMMKLTCIYALPAFLWGVSRVKFLKAMLITIFAVALPYALTGTLVGLVQGQLSSLGNLRRVNGDISIWSWLQLQQVEYLSSLKIVGWEESNEVIIKLLPVFALLLQVIVVTSLIVMFLRISEKSIKPNHQEYWVISFILAVTIHMTRLNAQDNHWFFILPFFFPALAFLHTRRLVVLVFLLLTLQDLLAQGFGRSILRDYWMMSLKYIGPATVAISALSTLVLIHLILKTKRAVKFANKF